ncbi:hypothetical protein [Streptomyces sp. WAC05858]|uniref:hypothetical protein n=1 Tax=Streptomyces TaxID=1883 RepID=UPI000F7B334C|nr:hypothetical protein [Streptomyces sp. WAC05858]RSS37955.1 hypothetical protein EF902_31645 [Streptomyces sp. WAC05858]
MRPMRFEEFAVELATKDPVAGKAMKIKESGESKYPYGLSVALNGREARFQFIAHSADGDRFDQPERPVEGDVANLEGPRADGPEGWLAGLLASSGCREIESIEQWSLREDPKDRRNGLTVFFYSGAKIYARAL